jgi:hypothetical protein
MWCSLRSGTELSTDSEKRRARKPSAQRFRTTSPRGSTRPKPDDFTEECSSVLPRPGVRTRLASGPPHGACNRGSLWIPLGQAPCRGPGAADCCVVPNEAREKVSRDAASRRSSRTPRSLPRSAVRFGTRPRAPVGAGHDRACPDMSARLRAREPHRRGSYRTRRSSVRASSRACAVFLESASRCAPLHRVSDRARAAVKSEDESRERIGGTGLHIKRIRL